MAHAHETDEFAGLPPAAAEQYVRTAAAEFAKRSTALRKTVEIDAQAGVTEYPICEDCELIVKVISVEVGGRRLLPDPGRPCSCAQGVFWFEDCCLRLGWTPTVDEKGAISVRVAVAPRADACEIDREFFHDLHRQAIIDGALSRILMMPNQPWTNAALARVAQAEFERSAGEARRDALMGSTAGPFFAHAPSFVGRRRFR